MLTREAVSQPIFSIADLPVVNDNRPQSPHVQAYLSNDSSSLTCLFAATTTSLILPHTR